MNMERPLRVFLFIGDISCVAFLLKLLFAFAR